MCIQLQFKFVLLFEGLTHFWVEQKQKQTYDYLFNTNLKIALKIL